MSDDDARAGARKKASGRRSDAAGAADDERESAVKRVGHDAASYLIGGRGRLATPGAMTKVYSSVYQGACTSGAGGVSPASWRRYLPIRWRVTPNTTSLCRCSSSSTNTWVISVL